MICSCKTGAVGARGAAGAELPGLTRELLRTAVAYDRAAGMNWADISAGLNLQPDAARKRYAKVVDETLGTRLQPGGEVEAPLDGGRGAIWASRRVTSSAVRPSGIT